MTAIDASGIRQRAERWGADDPDSSTSAEVQRFLDNGEIEVLGELFTGRIAFGTAGLRAAMGPGPNRMNRQVVRQTTAGLMNWLPDGALVVIGYDARHGSHDYAIDTAGVVAAAGGRAELLPEPLPTPVLAAAVLKRGADAGVMITASHNPKDDNGYKLYLADGIQLVSPDDADIAAAIDVVAAIGGTVETAPLDHPAILILGQEMSQHHLDIATSVTVGSARQVETVYTAMHGVGGTHLMRAFEQAGFAAPHCVAEQFDPDPEFPTVPFPNPEESGALDLALALAVANDVDLVLANDPDADRLAVAIPARDGAGFTPLSGDELGVLLADHLLRNTSGPRQVASSLVSSRLLERMAAAAGVRSTTTLTGFKWVARPILEHPDEAYVLGYEEAIGYCVGGAVRDKDGISAALVAAEMAADARSLGETLWDRLDRLALAYGLHRTGPLNLRFDGSDGMQRRAQAQQAIGETPPRIIAGATLASVTDLMDGERFFPTDGLVFLYDDDTRVIVRPSGTEPKLKAYVEVIVTVDGPDDLEQAEATAAERLEAFRRVFNDHLDRSS
jgi:phosphomannomutase